MYSIIGTHNLKKNKDSLKDFLDCMKFSLLIINVNIV